jgi:hypothetical protein
MSSSGSLVPPISAPLQGGRPSQVSPELSSDGRQTALKHLGWILNQFFLKYFADGFSDESMIMQKKAKVGIVYRYLTEDLPEGCR